MPLSAGTRLGPYEIVLLLGAGGMGEVYKARDTRLDRPVAIKVLPPTFATDPEFRARFEREARSISALKHPHICTLYDVGRLRPEGESAGTNEEVDFLVVEYLEGETLAARLKRGACRPITRSTWRCRSPMPSTRPTGRASCIAGPSGLGNGRQKGLAAAVYCDGRVCGAVLNTWR